MDANQRNKEIYESSNVVQSYEREHQLQNVEQTILEEIASWLASVKMLDVGVGAGRTTVHFAPLVKEYTAIDYSEEMIRICQKKFSHQEKWKFKVSDIRCLKAFEDHSFNFVLFSYNGIDYMSMQDRVVALKEIHRVLALGGLFCFSTHNIQYIGQYLKICLARNPLRVWKMLERSLVVKSLIQKHGGLHHIPYAMFKDGGEDFKVQTHYIKPQQQIQQLMQAGFSSIRIFSEQSAQEISSKVPLDSFTKDRWFYYLCTA